MSCYSSTALALSILSFLTCIAAFVTPHWLVSWEQKLSTFHRIGLWEVCFAAFHDPKLYAYKYYDGCWWVLHPELDLIRPMLNPAWFKAVQGFATLALFTSGIAMIFMGVAHSRRKKHNETAGYAVSATFHILTVLAGFLCIVIFGACAKDPQMYRLPMPQYSYFGAGYAMIILTTLASGFAFPFIMGALSWQREEKEERYSQ